VILLLARLNFQQDNKTLKFLGYLNAHSHLAHLDTASELRPAHAQALALFFSSHKENERPQLAARETPTEPNLFPAHSWPGRLDSVLLESLRNTVLHTLHLQQTAGDPRRSLSSRLLSTSPSSLFGPAASLFCLCPLSLSLFLPQHDRRRPRWYLRPVRLATRAEIPN
jgi:hypothetical protein